jgi:hypothetical protein
MNPKFSVLKTLLSLLPKFPTFIEACKLILSEEASREANSKRATEAALLAFGGTPLKPDNPPTPQPPPDHTNNNNFHNNGGRGRGRGRDGDRGHGGHNGGRGGNGGLNNFNGSPAWSSPHAWGSTWGSSWHAPWTGATGPGLLSSCPPPAQAYRAYQPMMMQAPLQAPSWDTSELVQALQATSLHNNVAPSYSYVDSSPSSHMTGDQANLTSYFPSLSHNSSQIVVGNGSRLPILGTGSTHIRAPNINFPLTSVLHTPDFVSNLISVHKFTNDNWCLVEFDPFGFSVKDLISKTTILRSNSSGDL